MRERYVDPFHQVERHEEQLVSSTYQKEDVLHGQENLSTDTGVEGSLHTG